MNDGSGFQLVAVSVMAERGQKPNLIGPENSTSIALS